jgi:hypothetical protein
MDECTEESRKWFTPNNRLYGPTVRSLLRNLLIQTTKARPINKPIKKTVPLTGSWPLWTIRSLNIAAAPAHVSEYAHTNKYRKGYFLIGQKGLSHEHGSDQSIRLLERERLTVSHRNNESDEIALIMKQAPQLILDRSPGIKMTPIVHDTIASTLRVIHTARHAPVIVSVTTKFSSTSTRL